MSATLRKIVQITSSESDSGYPHLYALCSDGTVWERICLDVNRWGWAHVDTTNVTTLPVEVQS
jgi:hypothetical protein